MTASMKKILIGILPCFALDLCKAQDIIIRNVNYVYDGDTFHVSLGCDFSFCCENIAIRVRDIDTPELNKKRPKEYEQALKAKRFTEHFLQQGEITLKNIKRGKYFRLIADVYVNGKSLSEELLSAGLAVRYEEDTKKKEWSEE